MALQENQARLFEGVVQVQPGLPQKGRDRGRDWDSTVRHPGGYLHCHRHHVNALAVTKQIVKGEGEGSVFAVRLPCIVGDDQDAGEELYDIEQEPTGRKLSETKTSRLLRPSFLNLFNDMAPHCAHGCRCRFRPLPLLLLHCKSGNLSMSV